MKIGDKVTWNIPADREPGWAGDGKAVIVSADSDRAFFPNGHPGNKQRPPGGPAVLIKMEHNDLTVWVEPSEIAPRAD